ncbi:hypothetical protein Tco_0382641 [Tanacetum coccineum]
MKSSLQRLIQMFKRTLNSQLKINFADQFLVKKFTAYPKVQENLKLPTEGEVRLEEPASSAGTLSSMKNLDKDLSFTDQFLVEKSQEDEPEKTNTEAEVQSMVTVPIHQDTSSVPLMTTPVIDITDPQSDSTTVPASMPTTTATVTETTTTTTVPPPPPQPQQDVSTSILTQTIGQLEQNIADLVDANQALEERLDKQGNRIHQLETQDLSRLIREQTVEFIDSQEIDRKIEESVKEVVTASVQHAMRAPLRARFKDLPTSDMKEILLQRMLEENYDKGHEDHKMAFEALQKSIIRDESEQFDADKAEERTKKKSKQDSPKTPPGSPPSPPPPPPPSGVPGASDTTGASDSAQDPPPPPPLNPTTSSIPEDVLMHEESDFEAQDKGSDDEDSGSRHIPKASALASSFVPLSENFLLSQTGDIGVFIDWFCKKQGITELTLEHLEGPAYEVVKAFHPDVIHLQFQMEECHKLRTNQVDEGLLRYNVSRPLPLGGPPGQVTIQTEFFFNKDLEYLRFGHKGDRLALSITKMKAASYPDAELEQMVLDQMWAEEEYMYEISASYGISQWWFKRHLFYIDRHSADTNRRASVRTHMRILSVVRIEVFSVYGYDYMKKIVLRRADTQEYTIAESDFKDLYPSNFEDLYLLNLQGHLNHLPPKDKKILSTSVNLWIRNLVIKKRVEDFQLGIESYQTQLNLTKPRWEATGLEFMHDYKILDSPRVVVFRDRYGMQMIMRFNEIYKFSDGTLQQIDEALDYRVKENLESFVGGRIREGDYWSYKVGKVRYSFPRSRQNRRDLPRDNPLVSVEVLSLLQPPTTKNQKCTIESRAMRSSTNPRIRDTNTNYACSSHTVTTSKDLKSPTHYPRVTNRFTLIVLSALRRSDKENRQVRSVLTDPEDQAKMEMEIPRSSGVNSPPNAHT